MSEHKKNQTLRHKNHSFALSISRFYVVKTSSYKHNNTQTSSRFYWFLEPLKLKKYFNSLLLLCKSNFFPLLLHSIDNGNAIACTMIQEWKISDIKKVNKSILIIWFSSSRIPFLRLFVFQINLRWRYANIVCRLFYIDRTWKIWCWQTQTFFFRTWQKSWQWICITRANASSFFTSMLFLLNTENLQNKCL